MTCCKNPGVSVWKNSQWQCAECGSAKSNDPDYLYGGNKPQESNVPKCVCGGAKAKTTHAHWCEVKN